MREGEGDCKGKGRGKERWIVEALMPGDFSGLLGGFAAHGAHFYT